MKILSRPWAVSALLLLALIPFVQRPFFFDDGSVVASAVGAARDPLRPYDFTLDLEIPDKPAWPQGGMPAYTHPPLTAWLLAGPASLGSERPEPLHMTMFLVAALGLLAARRVIARFTDRATLGTVLLAVSPAYFLTSLTLYPHLVYFVFYATIADLSLAIADRPTWARAALLGLVLSAAALCLHHWPLSLPMALMLIASGKNRIRAGQVLSLAVATFVIIYGGWSLWEWKIYGVPGFIGGYLTRVQQSHSFVWAASILPLIFVAGGVSATFLAWPALLKASQKAAAALAGLAVVMFGLFMSPWGGFTIGQALLAGLFFSTGTALLVCSVVLFRRNQKKDRILALWLWLEIAFLQAILTHPSGHHVILVALPIIIVATRLIDLYNMDMKKIWSFAGAAAVFTLVLAHADYSEATLGPQVASQVRLNTAGRSYFWGNSFGGFEYHLKKNGWQAFDAQAELGVNDVIVVPRQLNALGSTRPLRRFPLKVETHLVYHQANPLRTFSIGAAAGWYSASWGALPYSFATGPVEEFLVLRRVADTATR